MICRKKMFEKTIDLKLKKNGLANPSKLCKLPQDGFKDVAKFSCKMLYLNKLHNNGNSPEHLTPILQIFRKIK